jgi:hypothetical protein
MKPGRNDPCPCGSGKKFKKCHEEQWEADARARQDQERKQRREDAELIQALHRFGAPLIQAAGKDSQAVEAAVTLTGLCWDVAMVADDEAREAKIAEVLAEVPEEGRAMFRKTFEEMTERHRQMFPELHATAK